jgi:hypothetical protein
MRQNRHWVALLMLFVLATPVTVCADGFEIVVEVKSVHHHVLTKHTHEFPSSEKSPGRLVLRAKADEDLRVLWRATNTHRSDAFQNVLVHFFVVNADKIGQEKVSNLGKDVEHEGALTTDYKPKERSSGQFTLKVRKRGAYLLRVETIGMQAKHGHEYYAAVDLLIE